MLATRTWPNWMGRPKDGVREVMRVSTLLVLNISQVCHPADVHVSYLPVLPTAVSYLKGYVYMKLFIDAISLPH